MTPLDVRPARPADLDALVRLEEACFDPPWSRASLAADLVSTEEEDPSRTVLVGAVAAEVVAGGIVAEEVAAYASFLRVLDECELLRLAVLPEHRGHGHGDTLLRHGLRLCAEAGARICRLEVHGANTHATRIYRALGFSTVGRRRAYYADGGDALLLALDLPGP